MHVGAPAPEPRPWKRGLAWLAVLGPFFFASYGLANWAAAQRSTVPVVVFEWERAIAFLPWTIVPYWLIDLAYGASLVLCATRAELRTHVARLLFVQVAAVLCFLAFPLRYSFERPAVDGVFEWMFAALESFDLPYNQAPSLHAALLVVLWPVYLRGVPKRFHGAVHALAALIAMSVLTTWQHHFIDLPTGIWLGCLAVWLFRTDCAPGVWQLHRAKDVQRRKLAARYASGAALLLGLSMAGAGAWLILAWPAASLALVAIIYLFGDGSAYGKRPDGSFSTAAWVLFAPYFAGARINAWWWTLGASTAHEIVPNLYLGSLVRPWPGRNDGNAVAIDVCAELAAPGGFARRRVVAMLDLVTPSTSELHTAVLAIDAAHGRGPVLVACALGFSRSAIVLAAWLVYARRAATIDAAIDQVSAARPGVVLRARHRDALLRWHRTCVLDAPASRTAPERCPGRPSSTVPIADNAYP